MKLPIKRASHEVYTWDPFDEIRRMQEYVEQMHRSFPVLDTRFVCETLSPLTEAGDKVTVTTDLYVNTGQRQVLQGLIQ